MRHLNLNSSAYHYQTNVQESGDGGGHVRWPPPFSIPICVVPSASSRLAWATLSFFHPTLPFCIPQSDQKDEVDDLEMNRVRLFGGPCGQAWSQSSRASFCAQTGPRFISQSSPRSLRAYLRLVEAPRGFAFPNNTCFIPANGPEAPPLRNLAHANDLFYENRIRTDATPVLHLYFLLVLVSGVEKKHTARYISLLRNDHVRSRELSKVCLDPLRRLVLPAWLPWTIVTAKPCHRHPLFNMGINQLRRREIVTCT